MANTWTPGQEATILDVAWATGAATCPIDEARMPAIKHSSPDSWLIQAKCPECGRMITTKRTADGSDDPRAAEFRPWTDAEKASLITAHRRGNTPACPVDGAALKPISHSTGPLKIICDRCGESAFHPGGTQ